MSLLITPFAISHAIDAAIILLLIAVIGLAAFARAPG